MSMKETIAQLTGVLKFEVDNTGFIRFANMMRNANKQLTALAKEYDHLSKAIARGLKLKIDTTAVDKAKQKLETALKRQARSEAALANQQRQTFAAELTQQKLKYAGSKAQATLDNAHLQSKKEAAVVAAKAQAAQAKATGVTKQQLATQNALTASLTRQAKLEAIVQKTRAAAQKANDQHLASMSKLQRIQQQMNHAQQQAHIRAQKHSAQMAAAQQTAANKTQNANQSAQRFQMAQQRHAAWQARQNAPAPRVGMFGGVSPMLALGSVGAAIAGLSVAMSKLGERIDNRKQGVVDAERFDAAFVGLGKTDETRKFWKDTFTKLSNESGAEISNESAEDFRTFVGMQQAFGKNPDQIIKEYQLRQQAFAVAGLTKDRSREVNRQLNQVSTDGLGDKSDWNVISENMPTLAPFVIRAYGEEERIKDPVKAAAAFNKRMKKGGGVKLDWITKGMETMVAENQAIFESKKNSVGFAKTLQENQEFLNAVGINNSQELSAAMRDNIQAHRELNEALQPAAQLLKDFDESLTQAQTGLIRFAIGLNQDGSKKTEQQQMQDRMTTQDLPVDLNMAGTHDYSSINTQTQHQGGPIGNFWNWVFGIKKPSLEDKGQAQALSQAKPNPFRASESDTSLLPGILPQFKLDMSKWGQSPEASNRMLEFGSYFQKMQDAMTASGQMQSVQNSTYNAPITVEGNQVHVTINGGATEKDRQEMMTFVNSELDKRDRQMPEIAGQALRNVFGAARAQQAER